MFARSKLFISCAIALFLTGACSISSAITLDWDTAPWTDGSLTGSFDIDPSKSGNDLSLTVSGNTGQLQPKNGVPTPGKLNIIEGGLTPVQQVLGLQLDLANQSQSVTITVAFSGQYTLGVNNVSFTVFDVDFQNVAGSTFQDQLSSITALSIDGTTLIAPTITVSPSNVLTGSGLGYVVTGTATNPDAGAGSGSGNVTISFGTTAIKSFTFTYGSGSGTVANPTGQSIGIHDISFTPVPEMNPAWSAVGSCLLAAAFILRHSAKFRK